MHNRYDQFAKNLLRDALTRAGEAETEVEVVSPTQKIDVYCVPDPKRESERAQMGELGKLSAEPAMFEPFHDTPSLGDVRDCVRKQLTWHHELERRADQERRDRLKKGSLPEEAASSVPFPFLVVISRGHPKTALRELGCAKVREGIYESPAGWALRVVVLSELPRTRDTLLLRLLGSGRRLREALTDLAALPDDVWEKSIATPLLLHFQFKLSESPTSKEDDMSAEIQAWYEKYQQKLRDQARAEARAEFQGLLEERQQQLQDQAGAELLVEGKRSMLIRLLRARFGDLPETVMVRIESAGAEVVEQWGERVLFASSLDEVFEGMV